MIPMLPPAYFGPIWYFRHTIFHERVIVNGIEQFQKQTIRNRAEILGANGKIRLTVPLVKWSTNVPVNEIRIDNTSNWKHVHWMSIQSAYRNSAFFEHFEDQIRSFFSQEHDRLIDLNLSSTKFVVSLMKSELVVTLVEDFQDVKDVRALNLSSEFVKKRPTQYLPKYTQVFSDRFDFVPDLSVLDLIFNLGPRASLYLQDLQKNG